MHQKGNKRWLKILGQKSSLPEQGDLGRAVLIFMDGCWMRMSHGTLVLHMLHTASQSVLYHVVTSDLSVCVL